MYEENAKIVRKVNTNRPKMSRENRAKQFAPFAALKGFGDTIHWQEKWKLRILPLCGSSCLLSRLFFLDFTIRAVCWTGLLSMKDGGRQKM